MIYTFSLCACVHCMLNSVLCCTVVQVCVYCTCSTKIGTCISVQMCSEGSGQIVLPCVCVCVWSGVGVVLLPGTG